MKKFIRTLWSSDPRAMWLNDDQREGLRKYLNDQGFYVITGPGDSLEIYAVEYYEPWDIDLLKKSLDNCQKIWYAFLTEEVRP